MSTMKPDYFIGYNGLPNILLARSRRLITHKKTNEHDRVHAYQQQIHPPTVSERLIDANQQAHVMQCEKNVRNRAIKESLRNSKSAKDLINAQIVVRSSWNRRTQALSAPKCVDTDNNACNRNAKR